MLHCQSAVG